jgi:hypothetical protein
MNYISTDELRRMTNNEGLIIQGCGGDLNEWVNGINDILTEEGILLDGDTFKDVVTFENDGCTNLLFKMDDVKLDVGKLAMWRLRSHSTFGGYWLSDYLPNRLGVNTDAPLEQGKPECPIIGADGNIFNIMGIAARTLKDNGMADAAKEMRSRVTESGSYDNALAIIMEYVEPVEVDGYRQGGMEMQM